MIKDPVYEATLKVKKFQVLPKKCVFSHKIELPHLREPYNDTPNPYKLYTALWIPDIPYSKNKPHIGWTIRGKQDQFIRLIMPDTTSIVEVLLSMWSWIEKISPQLLEQLHIAQMEWLEFQRRIKLSKK